MALVDTLKAVKQFMMWMKNACHISKQKNAATTKPAFTAAIPNCAPKGIQDVESRILAVDA